MEERISNYYNFLYNKEILWQQEHKKNGLPDLNFYINFVEKTLKINYRVISHGSVNIWEKFIRMEFMAGTNEKVLNYWNHINSVYNDFIFDRDFNRYTIRKFIIAFKDKKLLQSVDREISIFKKEFTSEYQYKIEDLENNLYNLLLNLEGNKI